MEQKPRTVTELAQDLPRPQDLAKDLVSVQPLDHLRKEAAALLRPPIPPIVDLHHELLIIDSETA